MMLRPLGTTVSTLTELRTAPWGAVLLHAPHLATRACATDLPPCTWRRVYRDCYRAHPANPTTPTLRVLPLSQFLPFPDWTPPRDPWALAVTPHVPFPVQRDRLLARLRHTPPPAFVRLDNWTRHGAKTGLLAPDALYPPAFFADLLRRLPPETPLLLTRASLTDTLHDCGLLRLWDAVLFPAAPPLPLMLRSQIDASLTGVCPVCPGQQRLLQGSCSTCRTYWGISDLLLSPFPALGLQGNVGLAQEPDPFRPLSARKLI